MSTRLSSDNLPPHIQRCLPPEERARMVNSAAIPQLTESGSPAMADTRAEKDLQGDIAHWLDEHGYAYAWHRMDKPTGATLGLPDFLLATKPQPGRGRYGIPLAIEVKNAKGRLSPWQKQRIAHMQARGWAVEVCRSLAHAIDFIRAVEKHDSREL